MRTLAAKEIRLLLPGFAVVLALAVVPGWLLPRDSGFIGSMAMPYLFWFGFVMLAVSSFGREFGLNTMPFLLAQPLERGRIWRIKTAVLAVFVVLAFGVWWVSGIIGLLTGGKRSLSLPPDAWAFFGLMLAAFAAGGLWMTLLLRQMAAAFWLSFLLPIAVGLSMKGLGAADWMLGTAMGLYAVAAFLLAWRQFLQLQDTAWTGGVIAFGGGRAAAAQSSRRERRPWAALFGKELQLQQVTLLGMGCLLVLHLGVVALRKAGAQSFGMTTLMVLDGFGLVWFLVPLLAGSQSVADERKLGTMQAHLCLPVSRRAQWFVKLMMALVIGGLLSWALYWAVEIAGGDTHGPGELIVTGLVFLVLALAGFYGSTLTGGVVQALPAALLTLAFLWGSNFLLMTDSLLGLWAGALPIFICSPVLVATVLWLSYRNFGQASESWLMWRRNALTLAGMLALSLFLTQAIYHRAWEWITPLEPAPGPARISLEKPSVLKSSGVWGLALLLPDGRLWVDHLTVKSSGGFYARLNHEFGVGDPLNLESRGGFYGLPNSEKWVNLSGKGFPAGSNWVDAVAGWSETVAIQSDGTLWISEKRRRIRDRGVGPSSGLVQVGEETNWLSATGMFLLKRDGTLWEWDTNSPNGKQAQRSRRDDEPHQLGTDSDWARMMGTTGSIYPFAWKTDGSAWAMHAPGEDLGINRIARVLEPGLVISRLPDLDNIRWRSLITSDNASFAGVRENGTLWYLDYRNRHYRRTAQVGKDSDWAGLAGSWDRLVARKSDGSIWTWPAPWDQDWSDALHYPPVRLGTRRDWVALGDTRLNVLSLAADGNLWIWPSLEPGEFLAASRKPALIENIFGAGE